MSHVTKIRIRLIATGIGMIIFSPIIGTITTIISGITTISMSKFAAESYATAEALQKTIEESDCEEKGQ